MTYFLKIAKSIVVHFAHICAYGVETVNLKCVNFKCIINFFSSILTSVIYHTKNIQNVMEKKSVNYDRIMYVSSNMDIVKKRIEMVI